MRPDRCRGCGREVYRVLDARGDEQMLDATAETFRMIPEREAAFTAEHSADTFVLHRFVCRCPLEPELVHSAEGATDA